ncbi:MAG: recombinase family protein, partial [Candidatus Margulisiibacteriota bacterium]
GARQLTGEYEEKVNGIVKYLVDKGYKIHSGGALGADQFALSSLLKLEAAKKGVIYAAWSTLAGFPKSVRPSINEFLINGGKINAVVVKKLDRLSRSLLDFEAFMLTAQKNDVEFISIKENFDTTTATCDQNFKDIENPILKHNQTVDRQAQKIRAEINMLENRLENITDRKDRYLDSLISSQFLSSERQRINDKLAELELEEKQIKANIYKQEFELNQKEGEQINITSFKQTLISFRKDYETFSPVQLRNYLLNTLASITYYPEKLAIHFKHLPWPVDFPA